ncbi:MAG: hypothetical protein EA380_03890 [Phycisphaeraceae bacterium]|nr:MAG: hypothetical protein EA380_03890 [Phycisphaeraceae bacterium]
MHIESLISESRTLIIAGERTREGVPIFGGLASMLPETTGSRIVLSVCTHRRVQSVFEILRILRVNITLQLF